MVGGVIGAWRYQAASKGPAADQQQVVVGARCSLASRSRSDRTSVGLNGPPLA